jgi:hypothetical protein
MTQMQRRTFLTGAFVSSAALALGVNLYPYKVESPEDDRYSRLLFSVLIPVFLDGMLPEVAKPREIVINRTLDAISQAIVVLPTEQQTELAELLGLLESRLGLLLMSGSITPLIMRNPSELVAMLESWRHHYLALLQTAYLGLRELVMASYYACPEHWGAIGYAKPSFLIDLNTKGA